MTKRYLMGRIRAALRRGRQPRVAIIGAGFGGLAAAVALRRIGVDDIFIIERGDGVGGTWRQNTYPGAACDIQSHLYSFSFAPNRNWSRTYAHQPEILAYLESVAETFDLNRHLLTDTKVCSVRWNPKVQQWDLDLESVSSGGGFGFSGGRGDQRGRPVRRTEAARHLRTRPLRRPGDAHLAVGFARPAGGPPGGRHRNGGQRGPGGARAGRDRRRT